MLGTTHMHLVWCGSAQDATRATSRDPWYIMVTAAVSHAEAEPRLPKLRTAAYGLGTACELAGDLTAISTTYHERGSARDGPQGPW